MKYPFLDLRAVQRPILEELQTAAVEVIASGRYLHGSNVSSLERELADRAGLAHGYGVACSNGLDALRLIFRGYMEMGRLAPGDKVMVAANAYIACVLPITEFGLQPVLIEPDTRTFNLDWKAADAAWIPDVKAVLAVHLYGTPCWDGDVARRLADKGVLIIEDNAQAIGARAQAGSALNTENTQAATGGLAHVAAYSFYPTKNIGAMGDAGAVVTPDAELAAVIRALANYGADKRYHNIYCGWNCRMDELQAALLRVKLRHLDAINMVREMRAKIYDKGICNQHIIKPEILPDMKQTWHQYVVQVDDRTRFTEYLTANGVGYDIHYAVPPHCQPCYAGKLAHDSLPVTERLAGRVVSLPIAHHKADATAEIAEIVNAYAP